MGLDPAERSRVTTTTCPDARTYVLDDDDVVASVDQAAAIGAVRDVLRSAHRGAAQSIAKSMALWDGPSTAHTLGAVDHGLGLVAFKSWVNTPVGASAILTVFDAVTGALRATMTAGALGSLRTGATAAAATDVLAVEGADLLAVLGSGRQAYQQVKAASLVRPITTVRVWSRDAERRDAFATRLEEELGLRTERFAGVEAAVRDVPIVTTITRASEPFLERSWLATGAHVNAMGAILPGTAELLPGVVEACGLTVVDDLDNARRASKELRDALGDDLPGVTTLGELLEIGAGRPPDAALTVFKGMGSGLSDLAVASLVVASHQEGRA